MDKIDTKKRAGHHPIKKFFIRLKVNWLKILLITLGIGFLIFFFSLIFAGLSAYSEMEDFMQQQMRAQAGMYMLIGIPQAVIFVAMYGVLYYFMMNGSFMMTSKVETSKANVKWDEVIGMDSIKKEAWEIVKLLRDRHLLKAIGGKIIKGTLMIGPPGCGKTYLAKAISTECGLPMISAVGSDFVGMFVGQGAAQMKSLFKKARNIAEQEGGCIIFIDEIDSFARPRMADTGFGGGTSHNATINQFLTELDGLRQHENNIVIIAATNASETELDSAIMRSGRFDRKLYVNRPNLQEREDLFKFYLNRVKYDSSVKPEILSRKCLFFTPSDIDAMVREAGLIALRDQREEINNKDLSEAYDRVTLGDKANINMTAEDKKWTAYHEAGHAILAYLIHPKDDVIKASIVPRKGNLGLVSHRPTEESYSYNREYFMAQIKICVASYIAENMTFGSTTSGVGGGPGSDFHTALSIARNMVYSYGMGPSGLIGDFQNVSSTERLSLSEKTKETLDADVQTIMQECLEDVRRILTDHKDLLERFARELLLKEELEYDEIQAIFDEFNLKPMSGRIPLALRKKKDE